MEATHPRGFASRSALSAGGLALGLAPALTPSGLEASPSFFHGVATHPRALAQGLITLADITATRYVQVTPSSMRDPVLTGHGDRLRAEVFSADNSVYARLDVLGSGLDGGEIGRGTTNVDIGSATRQALAQIAGPELLHLDVGRDGLSVATLDSTVREHPVRMPERWVRALGNAAELHSTLVPRFEVTAARARTFIATLPPPSVPGRSGWLIPSSGGVRIGTRPAAGAVWVDGLQRLSALKRVLILQQGMVVYGPADGAKGGAAVEALLPGARLLLALTESATRGYSGEGALLTALAAPGVLDDAALVSALLAFEPVIDVNRLAREAALGEQAVRDALAVLATSGRVGWDIRAGCHFHRELPDDPSRVERDHPRLARARTIAGRDGAVHWDGDAWLVDGGTGRHRVSQADGDLRCTCTWYLSHSSRRGPCAHMLAVKLTRQGQP